MRYFGNSTHCFFIQILIFNPQAHKLSLRNQDGVYTAILMAAPKKLYFKASPYSKAHYFFTLKQSVLTKRLLFCKLKTPLGLYQKRVFSNLDGTLI